MDIEEGKAITYLLIIRVRKSIEKQIPQKELVIYLLRKEKTEVVLYFFTISASASSSWILQLLV